MPKFEPQPWSLSAMHSVKYYSQRDNFVEPWRTCNSSSHAMLASFWGASLPEGDDGYLTLVRARGDTTDWDVHTAILRDVYKIESFFTQQMDFPHLDLLLLYSPVPIGILHNGTRDAPTGGHVILVIGRARGGYICHDPWGDLMTGYTDHDGERMFYPREELEPRWHPGGAKEGFGRVVLGKIPPSAQASMPPPARGQRTGGVRRGSGRSA